MDSAHVRWREVVAFTVLAYVIAWVIWAPLWPVAWQALADGRTPATYQGGALTPLGMFAPAIAAVLMRVFVSRDGLRGSRGPRRAWRALLIAVAGPIVLVAVTVAVAVGAGLAELQLGYAGPTWQLLLLLLVVGTPVGTALAFGEEYGWRGYLLPRLLPLREVRAAIVVGLIWAPWHLPVLLAGINFPGKHPLAVLGVMTAAGLAMSLLFTRLFVASGGAVLAVAVLHGSLNAFSDRLADPAHLIGDPFVVSIGGVVGILLMLAAAVAAYRFRRARPADPLQAVPPLRSERQGG
jgi:membrane protease YdiL (CAAX protease family)